jgi:6-phosphogluconolactonase (cycloisomerase 2 family)
MPDAVTQSISEDGDVFTQTNASSGNAVLRYHRSSNGHLSFAGSFATGGKGAGAAILAPALGPSHTIQFARHRTLLYAVDAGSNDIAAFSVSASSLHLIGRFAARGAQPVSIAVIPSLLYVMNAGSNSISGFTIDAGGALHFIAGSRQSLSGTAGSDGPVDLRIADSDRALVATEKFANIIDTFALTNGRANPAVAHAPAGQTPFGMAVRQDGLLVNTEAFNDTPGASALTSYRVSAGGALTTVSANVHNGQTAMCWAAFAPDEASVYVTNTASSTISEFHVAANGTVSLVHATAGTEAAGSAPIDVNLSSDGKFLYLVNEMAHSLRAFSVNADGTLSGLQTISGLPPSTIGIAVH